MEDRQNDRFPVVSYGTRTPPTWNEALHKDHPDWREGPRGPEIGTVTIAEAGSRGRQPTFTATFRFTDAPEELGEMEYSGPIPGDGSWRGKGRAARRKGPGREEIEVDSVNPKRWG
jgi:hypothetical protein